MAIANQSELDRFMTALIGQESGGDPTAQNDRTGAYGIGQIMPDNWYPWAVEAGADPNDYSESNQRRIIRFKLEQYFQSFGRWEDVASAWYSGSPMSYYSDAALDAPQGYGNEPSIREYVNGVMGRMGETSEASISSSGYAPRADGLSEPFGSRLDALLAAFGGRVWINSGFRSIEEQTALWEASDKSGIMVAAPGSSFHNKGMAADLGFDSDQTIQEVHAVASQYGLWFPMDYENWHIEPIGSRDGTYVEASGKSISGLKGGINIPNPLGAISGVDDLVKKVGSLFNFDTMFRIGQFLAGAVLVLFGLGVLFKRPIMNVATSASGIGAAGKVLA